MNRFISNTFVFLFIVSQTSYFESSLCLAKLKNRTPQYKRHFTRILRITRTIKGKRRIRFTKIRVKCRLY
jgi:hypothetical protein